MGTFNCILDIVSGRDKVMALCKWQKLGKTELPMTSVELNLSILSSAKTREMWRWREKPAAHAMWHPNFPLTKVGWSSVLLSVLTQGCRQILLFPWPLELTHYFGVRWSPAAVFGDLKPEMIVGSKKGCDCTGGTDATELWVPGCYRLCPGTVNTGRHTKNTSLFLASMWCWYWLRMVNGANC